MNRSQSAAESDPELGTGLEGLDGLREWSRLWVPGSTFALTTLGARFNLRLRDVGWLFISRRNEAAYQVFLRSGLNGPRPNPPDCGDGVGRAHA